jgi:predicted metalloprotease
MKFDPSDSSSNVEDRRGMGGMGVGSLGIGGVIVLIIGAFLGVDPSALLNTVQQSAPPVQSAPQGREGPPDEARQFVANVLGTTEKTWSAIFARNGSTYRRPKLVLFEGATPTACGTGQSAMGPFYCPADEQLYIDLAFFRELATRFRAPGDFAQAYVIAHEVGHHVQKLSGTFDKLEAARGRMSKADYNRLSVRTELQADCYAGVWAHSAGAANKLERGDIEEGIAAAAAVGDDRLQRQSQGRIVPESFTHGSSAQRVSWFQRGMQNGRPEDCDTFANRTL